MLDSLIAWCGMESAEDMYRCIANRGLWRDKIDYPAIHGI
jgi:hypothetical protein